MDDLHKAIWEKFRVKQRDTPPYTGWYGGRETLAEFFGELGYHNGAEIGVFRGEYSEILCKANPKLHLRCIDPWAVYYSRKDSKEQEDNFKAATNRLAPYSTTIIRKFSMEAVKDIPDASLDFVYIDGDHTFDAVMCDLIFWSQKVKRGGIVAGHDYTTGYRVGVIEAVNAYVHGNGIFMWYVTRQNGVSPPSFFWPRL